MKTYSAGRRWYSRYILDKYLDASVGVHFFYMNLNIVRQCIICLERKNALNINNAAAATLVLLFFCIPSKKKAGVEATDAQMLLIHI